MNGKELSYNNLVDVDAAVQLISEFQIPSTFGRHRIAEGDAAAGLGGGRFAIIKHTNVCGIAPRKTVKEAGMQPWPEILKVLLVVYWFAMESLIELPQMPLMKFSLKC